MRERARIKTAFIFLNAVVTVSLLVACSKSDAPIDATQPLAESFAQAKPETQQMIETANNHLRAKNYTEAARSLMPIVSQQALNEEQKQAVGLVIDQINHGISQDPNLDTKELYDMRALMWQAVRGNKRF